MGTIDYLRWRDEWLLNMDLFDSEHKDMVSMLNRLASTQGAMNDREIEAHLEIFDQLVDTIRSHFKKEERFMYKIGYPGYQNHKSEHAMELAVFSSMRRELNETKRHTLSFEMLSAIKSWFLDHVASEDREYAEYYFNQITTKDDTPSLDSLLISN